MGQQLVTQMFNLFYSFFKLPDINWQFLIIAGVIAIIFGAIWLSTYLPPLFKQYWMWIILVAAVFSSVFFISFLQLPLQYASTSICNEFLSRENQQTYILGTGIPAMIIAGFVQAGAKLLPLALYWLLNKQNFDARLGLMYGAMAGAGFGIIEAFHVHGQAFALGWNINLINKNGLIALLPFIERFFTVGFHISAIALAGYGLVTGKWWQFYLIASALYAILNISSVLMASQIIGLLYVEILIIIVSIAAIAFALWLRWSKSKILVKENINTKVEFKRF